MNTDISSPKYTNTATIYTRTFSNDVAKIDDVPTTTSTTSERRTDAAKYSFGSGSYARSSDSASDADVIFGSNENRASFERSVSTTSTTSQKNRNFGRDSFAASVDVSDTIYASHREPSQYNRSLSVASDKDGDFTNDPRVNASYRIYEGIQNAGFTDYDSPVKTVPASKLADLEGEYDLK